MTWHRLTTAEFWLIRPRSPGKQDETGALRILDMGQVPVQYFAVRCATYWLQSIGSASFKFICFVLSQVLPSLSGIN